MNSLMSMRTIARSSSNRNSASALVSSVLPTPVGPRNRKLPIGRFGSCSPARARRTALADRRQRLLLADHALAQLRPPSCSSLSRSPSSILSTGMPVQRRDHAGDALLGHRLVDQLLAVAGRGQLLLDAAGSRRTAARDARARSPRRCASSTSVRAWSSSLLQLLASRRPCSFSACQRGGHRVRPLLQLGQLLLQLLAAGRARPASFSLPQRLALDLQLRSAGGRARPAPPACCPPACAAGSPPRRSGRSPCPAGSGR